MILNQLIHKEQMALAREWIDYLPEQYKKVMKMYLDGFTDRHIAEELGTSTQYANTLRNTLFDKLRKRLNNEPTR